MNFQGRNATVSTMVEEEMKMCGDPCFRALNRLHSCYGCDSPDCQEFVATLNATCSNQTFWDMGEELLVISRVAMFSALCVEGGCGYDWFPLSQCAMGGGMMDVDNETESICEANSTCAHHVQGAMEKCHGIIPREAMDWIAISIQTCECTPLLNGLPSVCTDPMDICNRNTACGQHAMMIETQCSDFPGVGDMLAMCENPCMPLMADLQSVCQNIMDACNHDTTCGQRMTMVAMTCGDIPEVQDMLGLVQLMCEPNPPPAHGHCVDIPTTVAKRYQTKPCM